MCVSAFLKRGGGGGEGGGEEEEGKKRREEKKGEERRRRKYIKEKGYNYKLYALPKMTMKQSDRDCDSINSRRAGSNKKSM